MIGSALVAALAEAGHTPVPAVRDLAAAQGRWPGWPGVQVDFTSASTPEAWRPHLVGIDAVINAVGILREHGPQSFAAVHAQAPCALFRACAAAGVQRVVQISALGAGEDAGTAYHRSKHEADRCLLALPIRGTVLQPSLVFAPQGASARMFLTLAALPVLGVPGHGRQPVAPVHLEDLVAAVLAVLHDDDPPVRLSVVGPHCLTLRDYLSGLRAGLGLGRARILPTPMPLVRLGAAVGSVWPGALLDRDTLAMLERGNCDDPAPLARLLGRPPRAVSAFLSSAERGTQRREAQLRWLLPLLRLAMAAVWLATGIVSLGVYPVEDSLALLARTGLTGTPALWALYSAAVLDLAFGIGLLTLRRRRWLYRAQALLILAYTAIITWHLPEFWLHPYGPVLKNLPMLAGIVVLHELEE